MLNRFQLGLLLLLSEFGYSMWKSQVRLDFMWKVGIIFFKSWWLNLTTACKNNIFLKSLLKSATYIHTHMYVYVHTHKAAAHTHFCTTSDTKKNSMCLLGHWYWYFLNNDFEDWWVLKMTMIEECLKPDWKKGLSFFFTISLLLLPTIHSMHVMQ